MTSPASHPATQLPHHLPDQLPENVAGYARQSVTSDPGRFAGLLHGVAADLTALQRIATGLVFHYRGGGDFVDHGIAPERVTEIDARYADLLLERLGTLAPGGVTGARRPAERVIGSCRDFTLLFLTMARHVGIPARARVGYAGYYLAGWFIDHVVAEVWDASEGRWRLVEAQEPEGLVDATDGAAIDVLDVDRSRFVTGPDAWRACRAGTADPERFVVHPELELPETRSWPQLAESVRLDAASLDRQEMLQWDDWGVATGPGPYPEEELRLLDGLAAVTGAPDPDPAEVAAWLARPELAVPPVVTSWSPAASEPPLQVPLRPRR